MVLIWQILSAYYNVVENKQLLNGIVDLLCMTIRLTKETAPKHLLVSVNKP